MPTLILTYMSGPEDGRTDVISIAGGNAVATVGRQADCTISIPGDPDASRTHARLFHRDGEWWLEDAGSTNGTFIGEFAHSRKISAAVKLPPGEVFRVGLTRFRLENENRQGEEVGILANTAVGAAQKP